jgi:hypothetical protein
LKTLIFRTLHTKIFHIISSSLQSLFLLKLSFQASTDCLNKTGLSNPQH